MWRAGLGLTALAALVSAVAIAGPQLTTLISFKTIGLNYSELHRFVEANTVLAVAAYLGAYAILGLFLLPGSALVVVLSGLLFGAALGIPLSLLGSTIAATLAFTLARFTVGRSVGRMSHPMLDGLRDGFHRHELSYMMFLRLTPGLPFGVINVGPALLGVSFASFVSGTAAGLLPSRIALSTAGASLAHAIDAQNVQYSQCLARQAGLAGSCAYDIHLASLLTFETLAAFVALAVLALVPALMEAVRQFRHRASATAAAAGAQRESKRHADDEPATRSSPRGCSGRT